VAIPHRISIAKLNDLLLSKPDVRVPAIPALQDFPEIKQRKFCETN